MEKPAVPTMVEFACSNESELGKMALLKGVDSLRLSESFADLSSQPGYQRALKSISSADLPIHLHGSLPCTPWSRWQSFNTFKLGADFHRQLELDRAKSIVMLGHFLQLARHVQKTGGTISFEWPRFCAGWDLPLIKIIIS